MSHAQSHKRPASQPLLPRLAVNYGRSAGALGLAAVAALLYQGTAAFGQELTHSFRETLRYSDAAITENPTGSNLCAMAYIYDNFGELQECCGCPLAPATSLVNSLGNLIDNPEFYGGSFDSRSPAGSIYIYSADPNVEPNSDPPWYSNGDCDPTVAFRSDSGLQAWLEISSRIPQPSGSHGHFFNAFNPILLDSTVEANNVIYCNLFSIEIVSGRGACGCGIVGRLGIAP
jgi:hypothetical protein